MTTAELCNLIISKLGGNRVEFLQISDGETHCGVEFVHGGNVYSCGCCTDDSNAILVRQVLRDQGPLTVTQYSTWVEGVLNGGTRNEDGVVS